MISLMFIDFERHSCCVLPWVVGQIPLRSGTCIGKVPSGEMLDLVPTEVAPCVPSTVIPTHSLVVLRVYCTGS